MDRFDEMAREWTEPLAAQLMADLPVAWQTGRQLEFATEQVTDRISRAVAAALRDTDAKAREDCAKRCDKRAAKHIQESVRVKRLPERTPLREVMRLERVAAEAQACAAAIREGADACGTDTACQGGDDA